MARGIRHTRGTASGGLTPEPRPARPQLVLSAIASLLWLAACTEANAPATLAPAPTLMVVTPTPGPPPAPTPGVQQRYVVREGDTLSGIAARFGVSEEAILKENAIADRNKLYVGQELIIPPTQP